jgi:hypothetical protein
MRNGPGIAVGKAISRTHAWITRADPVIGAAFRATVHSGR